MRDKLTARQVQTLRKVGRYADGGGLYLFISRPGYKLWTFRYMLDGRAREMSLGPTDDIGLAEARSLALTARAMVRDGRDPIEVKNADRADRQAQQLRTMTFETTSPEDAIVGDSRRNN